MKQCIKCGDFKDESEFYKRESSKDGLRNTCKSCCVNQSRVNYINNREYKLKVGKNYYENNREKILAYAETHRKDNKEYAQAYYEEHKDGIIERQKVYYKKNKDSINLKRREYRKNNIERIRQKDIERNKKRKLSLALASSMYYILKGNKGNQHWEDLVNYSLQDLKLHLESQFDENMTWDNYGSYWEVDHIIPQNTFNISSYKDREFKICWSLANLRPLEKLQIVQDQKTVQIYPKASNSRYWVKICNMIYCYYQDNKKGRK